MYFGYETSEVEDQARSWLLFVASKFTIEFLPEIFDVYVAESSQRCQEGTLCLTVSVDDR